MNKKITKQEFSVLKEIAFIKGITCRNFDFATLNFNNYTNFPYISKKWLLKVVDTRLVITLDKDDAISFDDALKILADIKSKKIVKLNDKYSAEILEYTVKVGCQEFTFNAIERLYKAIKE